MLNKKIINKGELARMWAAHSGQEVWTFYSKIKRGNCKAKDFEILEKIRLEIIKDLKK